MNHPVLDPVTVEVIGSALSSIVEEMGEALVRASHSTNIKERRDCSTALFDLARARQVDTYLGNPDPSGTNQTTYLYRSATRAPVATAAVQAPAGNDTLRRLLVAAGLLAALGAGAFVWARA